MAKTIAEIRKRYEQTLINGLMKHGEQIAVANLRRNMGGHNAGTYEAHTHNLDDSIVWAVYNHGKLVEGAYGCAQAQEAEEPRKWYGRELFGHEVAMDFIHGFHPNKKGYALVVAAVMPYGENVELVHKYHVIAQAKEALKELSGKYKGSVTKIIHRGKSQ